MTDPVPMPVWPLERLPVEESADRIARVRAFFFTRVCPDAAGLLIFSRLNLYYFAGTMGGGVLWIPREGRPVLALRRGLERARLESPLDVLVRFRSFSELPALAADAGSPWPAPGTPVGVERAGLSWERAEAFTARLGAWPYVDAGEAVTRARAVKTPWEIAKLREAGRRHGQALDSLLPARIHPGMSERDIAWTLWTLYGELGHAGPLRMRDPGDEIFLGHVSAGASGTLPAHFNGPLGLVGEHAAAPVGGSPHVVWAAGALLGIDTGFSFEGYQTDKTRLYFAGPADRLPDDVRRAHDAALDIGHRAAEALRPGAIPSVLYRDACERAARLGVANGFQGMGEDQGVFLGHGIGLSVDEWPALARRFDEPLEENMVLALEPKVALPGRGTVGMEETYRVTPQGGEVLTGGASSILAIPE